jgi:hypothetical protein
MGRIELWDSGTNRDPFAPDDNPLFAVQGLIVP